MKKLKSLTGSLCAALTVLVSVLSGGSASAQTIASDDASNYTRMTWATNFQNSGFGFTPWVLIATSTNMPQNKAGFTIVSITNAGVNIGSGNAIIPGGTTTNNGFGIFANSGTLQSEATAFRGFSNSLPVGDVFKCQWLDQGAGVSPGPVGGFSLRNGNNTTSTNWQGDTTVRFAFYYAGGGVNSFSILDGSGFNYINVPFGSVGNGFNCSFTLETADTYRFEVQAAATGAIIYLADSQPLGGVTGNTIDSFSWFAFDSGGNQEFNHPQIISGSLVPPTIINVLPTNGTPYVSTAGTNVSFEVDTVGSTIATNGITLLLNGVAQTNLLFNTNGATHALLVTNNSTLTANTIYTVSIIATDSNGNRITNSLNSFNTFLQTDNFIEAEDYNENGGLFAPMAFPDANNAYANLNGIAGIDYNDTSTTNINFYRGGDMVQVLSGNDPVDHANYAMNGYSDYYVGFNAVGDWQDYTRVVPSGSYIVYARLAGFAANAVMELAHMATPTVSNSIQPNASLGLFVCPNTGSISNYTLVPLTDPFGSNVLLNFSGTNTFRTTTEGTGGTYNYNYLILVPNTNTNTLRAYLSEVSPGIGATAVTLDNGIKFTIANRQTSVNTSTLQVFLNAVNITGSASISNNAAGTVVTYTPLNFFAGNTTNIVSVVFTDMGSTNNVTTTNTWQFNTATNGNVVIPASYAQPYNAGTTNGFGLTMFKILDTAPAVGTLSNAWNELAGTLIDPNTSLPYVNLATNPVTGSDFYLDTNVVAFDITGAATGTSTFTNRTGFPYVPTGTVNNNIVMQALFYMQLTNGAYHLVVRSDDGFDYTAGPTPANTNTLLGSFDLGRGNGTPSDIYFTVLTNGLYPMSLFYVQEGSGGNIEFYSYLNGTPILVNDPTNANSIKVYQAIMGGTLANAVTLTNANYVGGVFTFSFLTQSGHTHYVEYKTVLPSSTSWTPLQTIIGNGSTTNVTDISAGGTAKYYRVRTQ